MKELAIDTGTIGTWDDTVSLEGNISVVPRLGNGCCCVKNKDIRPLALVFQLADTKSFN